jgi:cyanophycinase-like exopeptidase
VWAEALGVLPRLIVMPHFDRLAGYIGQDVLERLVRAVPEGMTLLGIDEDTALVRLPAQKENSSASRWQVMGRQSVSVFGASPGVYPSGQSLVLHAG